MQPWILCKGDTFKESINHKEVCVWEDVDSVEIHEWNRKYTRTPLGYSKAYKAPPL